MFIDDIKIKISPLWEKGFNKPFIQKLIDGSLSNELFEQYLFQDMFYLEKYVELCELALIVLMNCMLSYNYIFTKAEKQMDNFHNKYYEFVIDYVADNSKIFYKKCIGYLNERYQDISDYDKNELFKIFEKATEYELEFLDRVYKG